MIRPPRHVEAMGLESVWQGTPAFENSKISHGVHLVEPVDRTLETNLPALVNTITNIGIQQFVVDAELAEGIADEQAVLTALSDPDREHAFCVVQGEPGSGKSHLIRWLSVNWPKGKDVKLLLRRADGSLEGALRQLKDRLPEEFHEHFEGLGTPQRATLKGRANIFLNTLSAMMAPGHFEEEMPDERWCERYRPDELLGNSQIRSQWSAPSRILTLLDGADGNRDQQSASFNVFDVAELGDIAYKYASQLQSGAKKLGSALATESDKINSLKRDNWLPDEIASEIADEIPTTLDLIASLNRRRFLCSVQGVGAYGQSIEKGQIVLSGSFNPGSRCRSPRGSIQGGCEQPKSKHWERGGILTNLVETGTFDNS